ncbi:MAG: GHKL domain-containing protein [Frisingicoccus sp.]|nr:GHKL domain-containing protein [Frisingicoccus sp.]
MMIDVHKLILILIMGVFQTYILWRLIRKVFYKKPLGMKGYAVLIFSCILDIIIVTIMEVFSIFQFSESGIFVCLVCFELELIVETIDCRHGKWKKNDEWYVLCLIPLVTGGIWACLNKQFILADDIKAMIIMIVVWLNVFIFYFYETMLGYYQEVLENHQIIFQKKIYETRMEHVEKMEKQMSAFRHDLKNHLFALNIMAEENDIEQIKKYLQEMNDSLSRSVTRNYTENKAFDMLLNYFMIKANSADVIIRLTASIPKDLDWNMYDLNIVLGNLIDNAIEGVTYVVEKVIDLNIKYHKGILMIKVENNYNSELKIQEGRYLTTKENHSEEHGFGLENVSKVVEKYSGTMEIHSENNRFKVKLLLYQK